MLVILTPEEKKQRAEYMRRYRKRNPLQTAENNLRYWEKKVRELREKEAQPRKEGRG